MSIDATTPDDVVVRLAAIAAIVVALWWLTNVVAWATALRRGRQLARFTLPGSKRVAQLTLAIAMSVGAASCSVGTSEAPTMQLVADGGSPRSTDSATPPSTAPPSTAPPSTAPANTAPEDTAATTDAVPSTVPSTSPTIPSPTIAPPTIASPTIAPPTTETTSSDTEDSLDTEVTVPASPDPPLSPGLPNDQVPDHRVPDHRVVVIEGDNLWVLSEQALIQHGVDQPRVDQVAQYWRRVVAANDVRSGNPDLIVPGETITMPAHELQPTNATS